MTQGLFPWSGFLISKMPCDKCLEKQLSRKPITPSTLNKLPKCKLCDKQLPNANAHYCQDCAFQKGICCYCGIQNHGCSFIRQTTKQVYVQARQSLLFLQQSSVLESFDVLVDWHPKVLIPSPLPRHILHPYNNDDENATLTFVLPQCPRRILSSKF